MPNNNDDTDPSTPTARRLPESALIPPSSRAIGGTDPGVAPPPERASPPPVAPLGIVVPAPALRASTPSPGASAPTPEGVSRKADSVEILLEGIGDSSPDRSEARLHDEGPSGASHYGSRVSRPDDERERDPLHPPKVLLDRPLTPTAIRARGSGAAQAGKRFFAALLSQGHLAQSIPLSRRVATAALAGGLVALMGWVLLEATKPHGSAEAPAPASPAHVDAVVQVASAPSQESSAGPTVAASNGPPVEAPPAPSASAIKESSPSSPHSESSPAAAVTRGAETPSIEAPALIRHRRHPRPIPAPAVPSGDLGEFRPTP
jgi:hypothetical protein